MDPNLTPGLPGFLLPRGVLRPMQYLSYRLLKKLVLLSPVRGIMMSLKGASSTLPPQETDSTTKTVSDRSWSASNRIQNLKNAPRSPPDGGDGRRKNMCNYLLQLWKDDQGQDIAEYAVMLAVILVIVVGTIRLIGSNANNVFSEAASTIQ